MSLVDIVDVEDDKSKSYEITFPSHSESDEITFFIHDKYNKNKIFIDNNHIDKNMKVFILCCAFSKNTAWKSTCVIFPSIFQDFILYKFT